MTKWIKEIKKIGIRKWIWFVIYLKRDDCSDKLDIFVYYKKYGDNYLSKLLNDRDLAHKIDIILRNLSND